MDGEQGPLNDLISNVPALRFVVKLSQVLLAEVPAVRAAADLDGDPRDGRGAAPRGRALMHYRADHGDTSSLGVLRGAAAGAASPGRSRLVALLQSCVANTRSTMVSHEVVGGGRSVPARPCRTTSQSSTMPVRYPAWCPPSLRVAGWVERRRPGPIGTQAAPSRGIPVPPTAPAGAPVASPSPAAGSCPGSAPGMPCAGVGRLGSGLTTPSRSPSLGPASGPAASAGCRQSARRAGARIRLRRTARSAPRAPRDR